MRNPFQLTRLVTVAFLVLLLPRFVDADFVIFAADKNVGPVRNVNPSITGPVGSTGTIEVWAELDAGQIVNGLSLDLLTTTPGVVTATAHTVANPVLVTTQNRWPNASAINTGTLGSLFSGSNFVSFSSGLNGSFKSTTLDPSYDATADAFLVSSVDYTINAEGCTDAYFHVGPKAIDGPAGSAIFFGWGDGATTVDAIGSRTALADVTVCGVTAAVPEPSAFMLLGVCAILFALKSKCVKPDRQDA